MSKQSRRQFMSTAAKTVAVTLTANSLMAAKPARVAPKVFIHHVYFWLNNPENTEDRDKLIAGLRKLAVTARTIMQHHIGVPSTTNRDVVERSYQISWMLFFKNKAAHDLYQTDPAHLNFVKECSSLWKNVIVYDAEDI